ncbi:hypothetical protein BOTCAL_0020g00140 [Botryotinia calthae]|uniref:Secreted protein n=1 Tax=Botryotinia calthae TaxID=38488 RepID=A0A4Y8DEY7_9HELO|nr:hypothetical protein BOTCAL_0020g00140 [Botryotinia calthae]
MIHTHYVLLIFLLSFEAEFCDPASSFPAVVRLCARGVVWWDARCHPQLEGSSSEKPRPVSRKDPVPKQLPPSVYVRAPDRPPTPSADAPPTAPMDN